MLRKLALLLAAFVPVVTHAERLLNEPFDYADGALISVAPSLWVNHSGTAEQQNVESGALVVTGSEAEDANRTFTATPYSSGTLYASFDLVMTALPASAGGYFFHFKDTGTGAASTFLGRLFARTTGAGEGKYRLGISYVSTAAANIVPVEKDLDLNTAYKVVVRLDLGATNATVWINPTTESATSDRAVTIDTAGSGVGMSQVAFRQATGIGDLRVDNLLVGTRFEDVAEGGNAALNPPILSSLPAQRTPAGTSTGPLALTVADGESAVADLVLSATSSDEALVPGAGIVFGGAGSDRTVTVTPAAGRQGIARITLTVRDTDGNTANRSFDLIVGEPAIAGLADVMVAPGQFLRIPITVTDAEGDPLTVSVTSSELAVVPEPTVTGTGSQRSIEANLDAATPGLSRLTIVVSDGFNSITNGLNVTVTKSLGVVLDEPFDYPDETLLNLTGLWIPHSGTNDGPVVVRGGRAQLITTNREDINITYNSPTIRTTDGVVLYARMDVNFIAAPSSQNGSYFAHYLGSASGSFRGRLFAGRRDAPEGQFQIGLANNSATASVWHPTLVSPGQPLTLLVRYNVGTGIATLWVNPDNENSPSVTGTDNPFPSDMVAFALRQDSSYGSLEVDLLKIGTAYSDVLTPVVIQDYSLSVSLNPDGSVRVTFPAAALSSGFALQASGSPVSGWGSAPATSTDGDSAFVILPAGTDTRFFRLLRQ